MPLSGTIAADRLISLSGKVLITGGAGYLGRAILQRAQIEGWSCKIGILSRDEEKQWQISSRYGDRVRCILGDVRDKEALLYKIQSYDIIIHAAAIKFIPEAESNVLETIKTNLQGSLNVAWAAARAGVQQVIGISTDKSCQPVNTYGMTKALMERAFSEACSWGNTAFTLVRYGNVVGSTGSIVPIFRQQLAQQGRVTVTDERMTRFWISPDDAVDLILLALAQGEKLPGRIFAPRCGAMSIGDLAQIIAAGAPIDIIGIRPGEKMHEDLIHYQEASRSELLADYFMVHPATYKGQAKPWTYSSHSPAFWIQPDEMRKMIKEAEKI